MKKLKADSGWSQKYKEWKMPAYPPSPN
jgi:hypothetical protein